MSTKSPISRRVTAILALLFFIPALILFIMWSSIGLRYGVMSMGEKIDTYLGFFPGWLQNMTLLHVISLACCVIAISLAARSFKKHLLWVRVLMLMLVIVSIFIILFDIFQLM